ncbi:hypothetical protein FOTG_16623 [Fusarium oxysporum f. sp. vasinfectum 25433]|uniref:NACHT domain-containing protein n=1 Tax=Fusarium oxysporum f. sp. vasinfectum 25433 TaxID=1089449 RepID=X0M2W0_FUSOX|nr:hypothetical protein FOTG_16623 [Fusarium oxysporum f. sp. vasinfectum 25433]
MAKIPSAEAREQLEEKTFDRVLDIITQTSLHRRSPKLFIIYAHSNESLGINAHQDVVKGYISWFKKILFNVDSDKSPHGYGPVMETAHDGASNDIITNQLCLLPTSWDKRNVDYVLVFYSKLLARYMKYEREYSIQIDNQPSRTYSEALFEACNKYNGQNQDRSQKAYENDIRHLQKAYREKMGSEFHHVLTELALLRFRNRGKVPCYTVPIILFEDEKWDHEDKWDANFVEMSETELRVPVKFRELYQSFLKILLRFEPLEGDRPLIEAFLKCFETSVAKLKTSAMNATEYQTYFDVNVSKALRRLQDGTEYRMERPLTIGGVRDVLNVRALDHTFLKRVSGEDISWDLNDIDLEISERPGLENRKSRANRENENAGDGKISLHSLFNKRELEDIKEIRPNRIFIRGKPGVGKSVLCRRIMYEYSWHQMLRSRFELVILIPVRKLDIKDFSRILFEEYFRAVVKGREMSEFLKNLILEARELQKHKILVVLDGLDEARGWDREKRALLEKLLKLPTVLVTSRVTDDANNIPFDLWVNAVGLSMENVKAYLNNRAIIPTSTTARAIERFIGDYPAVREISQVPIYLDIICSSWDELSGRVPRSTALLEPRHNEQPTITSLYQGVVRSLWRKDIPLLHKFDNGELVDNEIVMAVRDFGRVERLVEPEIMVLEQIAITMMKENKLEFTEQDVADAIFLLESTHGPIPLTLERNLRKLSILRSSSTYSQRRYHFVHLTFQEYFAAKYVAHDPGRIKAYLKSYKYHPRFEMLWRFVPGLLSDPTPFFNFIEEEPLDLLGLTHERLVMHCLSEVDASTELPIRRDLKKRLTQWLLFECHFTGSSLLARDSQFPDEALSTALEIASSPERSKIRTGILEALQHSRAKFSDKTISALTALFKDNKSSVRSAAASALRGQATLSDAVILDLVAMLKDRDWNVRSAAAETLGGRANLSEAVVSAIVALLTDNDSNIQSAAAGAMRRQANFLGSYSTAER